MDTEVLFKQSTDIQSFCQKYIDYFNNLKREPPVDRYYFIDSPVFVHECNSFGFEMDCGESFKEKYGEEAFCSEEALVRIVGTITDVKVLGSGIFSQWRYYNHWAESSQALYDAVGWFKLAFNRLHELISHNMSMEKSHIDFIYEIERDCDALSRDIISRLCKRAINKMNKLHPTLAGSTDDYPSSFSFFDILSIELQTKSYNEINPHLQDFVEGTLDNEFDNLPLLERFVLEHSECSEHLECDIDAVHNKIYKSFHELLNEHWTRKKIQQFEDRR